MSLAGDGVIAIWNGIRPEVRADFFEWHNREHMPERVGIPGFRRGRRYDAIEATPEFFTLYETDTPQTLVGRDYLDRLNNPTPWTRKCSAAFLDASRSLCRVAASFGTGQGGSLMTLRYDVAPGREEEQRRLLAQRILPELADRPGMAGAHLCIADAAASSIETAEKKVRAERTAIPTWILLIEGAGEVAQLTAACRDLLPDAALLSAGAEGIVKRDLYRLQYTRCKTAGTAG
jgi:hypothetical protein